MLDLSPRIETDRNWLKGALGDTMHVVLRGASHNMRMILWKLPLLYAFILAVLLASRVAADMMV